MLSQRQKMSNRFVGKHFASSDSDSPYRELETQDNSICWHDLHVESINRLSCKVFRGSIGVYPYFSQVSD